MLYVEVNGRIPSFLFLLSPQIPPPPPLFYPLPRCLPTYPEKLSTSSQVKCRTAKNRPVSIRICVRFPLRLPSKQNKSKTQKRLLREFQWNVIRFQVYLRNPCIITLLFLALILDFFWQGFADFLQSLYTLWITFNWRFANQRKGKFFGSLGEKLRKSLISSPFSLLSFWKERNEETGGREERKGGRVMKMLPLEELFCKKNP